VAEPSGSVRNINVVAAEPQRDSIDIFRRLVEGRQLSVRYGRARLTVSRSGEWSEGDLGPAIERFEEGEIDAEALAWAFIRNRVVKHTPSFSWDDAELPLLLDRVVGVSTDPAFESSSPEDVAQVLVEGAEVEREAAERLKEGTERLARTMSDRFGFGASMRPILESMQHILGARYATDMKVQHTLRLNPKLVESMVAIQRPALYGASQMAQNFGAKYGAGKFDLLGLGGKGAFDRLVPKGLTAELFVLRRQAYPKMLDPGIFDVPFQSGVGLEGRFGIAGLSAREGLSKTLKFNGEPPWFRGVGEQLSRINKGWIERLKRSYPSNWHELDRDEVDAVVELMLDQGPALAWVPRVEIVREILAAKGEQERATVLLARSAEITQDVEAAFAEVESPDLLSVVEAGREAIDAHRDGYTNPALALASVLVSDIAHSYFGHRNFGPIRKEFKDVDPQEVDVREFSYQVIGKIWVRVVDQFEGKPDTGFNRNRTLHILGPHYSEVRLLEVLMFLAGLCRELQQLENRGLIVESIAEPEAVAA
jgi:hypothetical protein